MVRKSKIAISFPGCHRRGGVERVMLESANFLAGRGHETHAFAIDWDADPSVIDSRVIRHQITTPSRNYLIRMLSFIKNSRREISGLAPPADILAGFGLPSPLDAVIWMGSVHKTWIETSAVTRDFKGRMRQRLNPAHPFVLSMERSRFVNRRYRKVIAVSPSVKSDLMRFYGVPDDDIAVISNGSSRTEFSLNVRAQNRDIVRAKLGLKPKDRAVIFVANELERKGFGPLLRSIAALDDPSIHLLAVGRLNAASYAAEIEALGMRDRVHWTGPSSTVGSFYAASDLFVLPTQYEAWGLVIVEAMACGVPVVTSRLAGASIAVKEGETGVLLDNPQDTQEIIAAIGPMLNGGHAGAAAIAESVQEFAWDKVLERYESLLFECFAQ